MSYFYGDGRKYHHDANAILSVSLNSFVLELGWRGEVGLPPSSEERRVYCEPYISDHLPLPFVPK